MNINSEIAPVTSVIIYDQNDLNRGIKLNSDMINEIFKHLIYESKSSKTNLKMIYNFSLCCKGFCWKYHETLKKTIFSSYVFFNFCFFKSHSKKVLENFREEYGKYVDVNDLVLNVNQFSKYYPKDFSVHCSFQGALISFERSKSYKLIKNLFEKYPFNLLSAQDFLFHWMYDDERIEIFKVILNKMIGHPLSILDSQKIFKEAILRNHSKIVSYLLTLDQFDPTFNQNEPLKWAAENGCPDVFKVLLEDKRVEEADQLLPWVDQKILNRNNGDLLLTEKKMFLLDFAEMLLNRKKQGSNVKINNIIKFSISYGVKSKVNFFLNNEKVDLSSSDELIEEAVKLSILKIVVFLLNNKKLTYNGDYNNLVKSSINGLRYGLYENYTLNSTGVFDFLLTRSDASLVNYYEILKYAIEKQSLYCIDKLINDPRIKFSFSECQETLKILNKNKDIEILKQFLKHKNVLLALKTEFKFKKLSISLKKSIVYLYWLFKSWLLIRKKSSNNKR
jgi:hypothetical protein